MMPSSIGRDWSIAEIRELVMKKFNKRACSFQIKIALALRKGKDVVGIAATGAGKTLSFWIALLMALEEGRDSMIVVVTPLNLLGKKNVEELSAAGISAVAIDSKSATGTVFRDIERGRYNVVVVNPEILMKDKGDFEELWQKPHVVSRLLHFIYDEGHCVAEWASFRSKYTEVGTLRHALFEVIPIYIASATLPPPVLEKAQEHLQLRPGDTEVVHRSNDRPNIDIIIRPMRFAANTYQDLYPLIPDNPTLTAPPPKFLIFFGSTKETQVATEYLQSRLPSALKNKVKWFHSIMTQEYREEEFDALKRGESWGLCVTDAFGLGLDLSDIEIVGQWKAKLTLCTLWQRFGRAARGMNRTAIAIFFIEKKYLDEERAKSTARAEKAKETSAKRKAEKQIGPPSKRLALSSPNPSTSSNVTYQPSSSANGLHVARPSNPHSEPLPPSSNHQQECNPEVPGHSDHHHPSTTDAESTRIEVEKRRQRYHEQEKIVKPAHQRTAAVKQQVVVFGGPIDELINAGTRDGLGCRRKVINVYFENDKTDDTDHLECDNTPTGCQWCAPKTVAACCDLCSPNLLDFFSTHTEPGVKSRAPNKSHCPPYEMRPVDQSFQLALFEWREEKALEKLGVFDYEEYGVVLFMSDEILQRLIDCFHYRKLSTLDSIKKETRWRNDLIDTYGPSILALVHKEEATLLASSSDQVSGPSVQPSASSSTPQSSLNTPLSGTKPTKSRVCSACKQPGHNNRVQLGQAYRLLERLLSTALCQAPLVEHQRPTRRYHYLHPPHHLDPVLQRYQRRCLLPQQWPPISHSDTQRSPPQSNHWYPIPPNLNLTPLLLHPTVGIPTPRFDPHRCRILQLYTIHKNIRGVVPIIVHILIA
ncbi:hypothetical protein QCA50_004609 [Cerrena zonata]|uniref:DNA 3'-5' helicase n=1 Tax=Cerrena zonata TaxID=2478898 RepID=A0AAW0GH67_9APHY